MRTITVEVDGDATVMVDGTVLGSTPREPVSPGAPNIAALRETVSFFASVIKSGEAWSPTCEVILANALGPAAADEPLRHDTPLEVVIAATCHEANRQFCRSNGDCSHLPWSQAPGWQQASAIEGVRAIRDGTVKTPADCHVAWMAQKLDAGWVYGPQKSEVAKTHPSLVPYAELSVEERRKDLLFFTIAAALLAPIS